MQEEASDSVRTSAGGGGKCYAIKTHTDNTFYTFNYLYS